MHRRSLDGAVLSAGRHVSKRDLWTPARTVLSLATSGETLQLRGRACTWSLVGVSATRRDSDLLMTEPTRLAELRVRAHLVCRITMAVRVAADVSHMLCRTPHAFGDVTEGQ